MFKRDVNPNKQTNKKLYETSLYNYLHDFFIENTSTKSALKNYALHYYFSLIICFKMFDKILR